MSKTRFTVLGKYNSVLILTEWLASKDFIALNNALCELKLRLVFLSWIGEFPKTFLRMFLRGSGSSLVLTPKLCNWLGKYSNADYSREFYKVVVDSRDEFPGVFLQYASKVRIIKIFFGNKCDNAEDFVRSLLELCSGVEEIILFGNISKSIVTCVNTLAANISRICIIKVAVKVRPTIDGERSGYFSTVTYVQPETNTLVVENSENNQASHFQYFTLDTVVHHSHFDSYIDNCSAMVENVMYGRGGCILVNGQTGSGKSTTVRDIHNRVIQQMFQFAASQSTKHYTIKATYMQMYNEELFDIFSSSHNKSPLKITELPPGKIEVENITQRELLQYTDFMRTIDYALMNIQVPSSLSSNLLPRSSLILTFTIECTEIVDGVSITTTNKLHIVDLVGAEYIRYYENVVGNNELSKIARPLGAIYSTLQSIFKDESYIHFRESQLTRLLQYELLSKNIVLINCIPPCGNNYEETIKVLNNAIKINTCYNRKARSYSLADKSEIEIC